MEKENLKVISFLSYKRNYFIECGAGVFSVRQAYVDLKNVSS
jgi:hypothetical protein